MIAKKVLNRKVCIFIRAQQAEAVPPLGTVLGNLGINAVKFCKEFNEFTRELPSYFYLRVNIELSEDRNFTISVTEPTIGFIIGLLKFERTIKVAGRDFSEQCITLKSLVEIAQFKFPQKPLPAAVRIVLGTVLSAKIKVIIEEN